MHKVVPGEKFRPSASAWNAFIEAAEWVRANRQNAVLPEQWSLLRPTAVLVKNDSAYDWPRGGVVGLGGAVFLPTENENQYWANPVFVGEVPKVGTYGNSHVTGRWGVLRDPVAKGAMGLAIISGVIRAQVNLVDTWHFRADIEDGQYARLRSYPGGRALILDIDRSGTGTKWATLLVGVNPYVKYDGVLDEMLSPGEASAQMSIWERAASGWQDTGYNAAVYAPRFLPDPIAAGKKVTAYWHDQAMRLVVDDAEC